MRPVAFVTVVMLFSVNHASQAATVPASVQVPFVGCPSDGQLGPIPAPKHKIRSVPVTAKAAVKLAWYQASYGQGVLAPRGWLCFGTYGSSGSNLYVSPQRLTSEMLFSDKWKGITGSAVQLSDMSGGTSGRFAVSDAISRVFPAYRAYVAKQDLGNDKLPNGPYQTDTLRYQNEHTVEYTTPARKMGLGTDSRLLADDLPISGVNLLTGVDTDLVSLSVRLPADSDMLVQAITRQVEQANAIPPPRP